MASARLPSTALRYQATARGRLRSITKPRSYMTATLKADCAEPAWAARRSQPAPACWSFGMPTPWTSRRASSSMALMSLASARLRNSSTGRVAQSTGLSGVGGTSVGEGGACAGAGAGAGTRRRSLFGAAGGVSGTGTGDGGGAAAIAAALTVGGLVGGGGGGAAAAAPGGAVGGGGSGSASATIAGASGASSGERLTHAPTPAVDATTIANDATTTGRFSREGAAAGLPVIPEE